MLANAWLAACQARCALGCAKPLLPALFCEGGCVKTPSTCSSHCVSSIAHTDNVGIQKTFYPPLHFPCPHACMHARKHHKHLSKKLIGYTACRHACLAKSKGCWLCTVQTKSTKQSRQKLTRLQLARCVADSTFERAMQALLPRKPSRAHI